MTLALPWRHLPGEEYDDLQDLAQRIQSNLDKIAQQFPLGTNNVARVPSARVYNDAAIGTTTTNDLALTFNSERWDHGTATEQHSTSANTSRLTCQFDGLYLIGGHVEWASNAAGTRIVRLRLSGATVVGQVRHDADGTGATRQSVTSAYRLTAGDYMELVVQQASGGNLDVSAAGNHSPEFWWHWVCP